MPADSLHHDVRLLVGQSRCLSLGNGPAGARGQDGLGLVLVAEGGDDLGGAQGSGGQRRQDADAAAAQHHYPLPERKVHQMQAVDRHSQGLHQRRQLIVQRVRQGIKRVGEDGHVLGEGAGGASAQQHPLGADLVLPRPTVGALAAGAERLCQHPLAGGDTLHALSHLGHLASKLVPRGDGGDHGQFAAVEMEVGAADAAGAHPQENLARPRGRHGNLPDLDLVLAAAEGSQHRPGHSAPIVARVRWGADTLSSLLSCGP